MRIAVAQTRPASGDILRNIEAHLRLVELAGAAQASHIIFPELSLTGYEPGRAAELAMKTDDPRLELFQTLSDRYSMTIGVGAPTPGASGVLISMLIFEPDAERQVYSKQYLHADEEPFFVAGSAPVRLEGGQIAIAICYELSIPAHPEAAHRAGADIYLASVAKTKQGMVKAASTLADIATRYAMWVLISNCVGRCDDFDCAGGSAVWDKSGNLLGQLGETEEGLLILDTGTAQVEKRAFAQPLYESQ